MRRCKQIVYKFTFTNTCPLKLLFDLFNAFSSRILLCLVMAMVFEVQLSLDVRDQEHLRTFKIRIHLKAFQ